MISSYIQKNLTPCPISPHTLSCVDMFATIGKMLSYSFHSFHRKCVQCVIVYLKGIKHHVLMRCFAILYGIYEALRTIVLPECLYDLFPNFKGITYFIKYD